MKEENQEYLINNHKTLIIGIFSKCKPENKELAFDIVKTLYNKNQSLSNSDLSLILGVKIPYSIMNKLEKNKIIIKTEGNGKKMLVDEGISKPAYDKDSIQKMKVNNHYSLLKDAKNRKEINRIIKDFFKREHISERPSNLNEFIKIYNNIVNIIVEKKLYQIKKKYGKLEWRPQQTKKYKLNHEYIKMFIKNKHISLLKAIEKVRSN